LFSLERAFSLLFYHYVERHDLAALDDASPDPLVLLASRSEATFTLCEMLHDRAPLCLDRLGSNGYSALHVAIAHNNRRAISFLVANCPSLLETPDASGEMPSVWARNHGVDLATMRAE
jgi:hypothetical protein